MNKLFGNSISMAEKSLNFLWTKQRITSNNIANNDTPGYKSKYVTFEETFRDKLKSAAGSGNSAQVQQAIQGSNWQVHNTNNETGRLDGNNVNVDVESMELTRTALQYQYQLSSVSSDITRYRTAIKG